MNKNKTIKQEVLLRQFSERIPYLKSVRVISDVVMGQFAGGNRPIVVVNISGQKLPFYRSAHGTSGKTKGAWHAFFGFGKHHPGPHFDWMVKGTLEQIENHYESPAIKYYTELINAALSWPHELDLAGKNEFFNPHTTLNRISKEDFNEIVFGLRDRGGIRSVAETIINADVERINKAFRRNEIA